MFMIFTNDSSNACPSIASTVNTFRKNLSMSPIIHNASHNGDHEKNFHYVQYLSNKT